MTQFPHSFDSAPSFPPRQKSGLAITAMVLGILGLCVPLLGVVALILGIVGLVKAGNRPQEYGGKGMAITGICTGGLSILSCPLMIGILLPALSRARESAQQIKSGIQLRGIGQALAMYSHEYKAFPEYGADIRTRLTANGAAADELFVSPFREPQSKEESYFYCAGQSGDADPRGVLMFENPVLARRGVNVLFVDGHVEILDRSQAAIALKGLENVQDCHGKPVTVDWSQLPSR